MKRWKTILLMLVITPMAAACSAPSDPTESPTSESAEPETPAPMLAANAFYYYEDLAAAHDFYTDVLGFETVADYGFARILRVASDSYLTLVDAERGMHSADEPKTVTLALVTDELEAWFEYLTEAGVPMVYELELEEGRPHQGFVAVDPEGYYLEFERFDPHPENERLLPALDALEPLFPGRELDTRRPRRLGVRATVLWLYYEDTERANRLYTDLLGAPPIVDQGWAWGYRISRSGLLGVVDGERGLHEPTSDKGVTVSFIVDDVDAWFERARALDGLELRDDQIGDESGRVRVFVGYDPENTFLEWDTFLDVEGNERLLALLEDEVSPGR